MNMDDWLENELRTDAKKIVLNKDTKLWLNQTYQQCSIEKKPSYFLGRYPIALFSLICICILGGIGVWNPSLAKSIPPVYNILQNIHAGLFSNSIYTPYLTETSLISTQNHVTFSIQEIVYDYKEIGYRYTLQSNDIPLTSSEKNQSIALNDWVMINGEKIEIIGATERGSFIDDYTYQADRIITTAHELPSELILTLGVDEISTGMGKNIQGPWQIQTSLSQKTSPLQNFLNEPLSRTLKLGSDDLKVQVDTLNYTSLYTYLEVSIDNTQEDLTNQYTIDWSLIDSQGNTYIPQEVLVNQGDTHTIYTAKFNPIPLEDRPHWVKIIPSFTSKASHLGALREFVINYESKNFQPVLKRAGFGDIAIYSIKQYREGILMTCKVDPLQDMRLQSTRLLFTNGQNGIQCSEMRRISPNEMTFWFEKGHLQDLQSIVFYDSNQTWNLSQYILISLE